MLSLILVLVSLFVLNCGSGRDANDMLKSSTASPDKTWRSTGMKKSTLDGSYEFVSETLSIDGRDDLSERRMSDEWFGIWLFQNGRFSQTVMKKQRPSWYSGLPRDPHGLGFDGSAGSFNVSGNQVTLTFELSFYPSEIGRPVTLDYEFQGETLTLTEAVYPTKENMTKGKRVTVLTRTK